MQRAINSLFFIEHNRFVTHKLKSVSATTNSYVRKLCSSLLFLRRKCAEIFLMCKRKISELRVFCKKKRWLSMHTYIIYRQTIIRCLNLQFLTKNKSEKRFFLRPNSLPQRTFSNNQSANSLIINKTSYQQNDVDNNCSFDIKLYFCSPHLGKCG